MRTRSRDGGAELAAAEIGLFAGYPQGDIKAMAAIGRELSGRLRTANRTIHQLEV